MAEKGKKQIIFVVVISLAINIIVSVVMGIINTENVNMGQEVVRFILTLVLMTFLYRGYNAAKVIMQVLTFITAFYALISSASLFEHTRLAYIVFGMGLIYGLLFIVLCSKPIKEYIAEETAKRKIEESNSEESTNEESAIEEITIENINSEENALKDINSDNKEK